MSDPADAPAKPAHNLRGAILWTAGILVALGLVWFVGAVVVPVVQVRRVISVDADEVTIRLDAIDRLGGPEPACAKLIAYLRMPDCVAPAKWAAVERLGYCGRRAVPKLVEVLRSPDEEVRKHAAFAIGVIGPDAADAVTALVAALEDPNVNVRWNAFNALGRIGPAAKEALPAMKKAWNTPGYCDAPLDLKALDRVQGTR